MGTIPRHAEVDVVVDASPTAVWEVVGDPRRTGEWSHECLEVQFVDGAGAPAFGARFHGRNRVGRSGWSRTCEIVGYDPGREISWRTVPTQLVYRDSTIWTITVEPEARGTRITQRYEVVKLGPHLRPVHLPVRAGAPRSHRELSRTTCSASARWPARQNRDPPGRFPRSRSRGSPCVVSGRHLWLHSS